MSVAENEAGGLTAKSGLPSCRYAWDNFTDLFDERFVKYIEENIDSHAGTKG